MKTTLIEAVATTQSDKGTDVCKFWKKFTIRDAINHIIKAWENVKPCTLNEV